MVLPLAPTIDQLVGTFPTERFDEMVPPFISQIATLPLVSCQRMSPLPLLSKSPVPAIDQLVGTLVSGRFEVTVPPLINHIATWLALSRQSRSACPSPSKSRWP